MSSADRNDENQSRIGAWAVAMNFGYGVVGSVLLGLLIDWLAGTGPLWTLILLGVGIVGGGYVFVREALEMNRRGYGGPRGGGRAGSGDGLSGATGSKAESPPHRESHRGSDGTDV